MHIYMLVTYTLRQFLFIALIIFPLTLYKHESLGLATQGPILLL